MVSSRPIIKYILCAENKRSPEGEGPRIPTKATQHGKEARPKKKGRRRPGNPHP
jgi:hypothetical protein